MILKNTDFNPNCGEYLTLRVTIAEGTNFITLWVTNGAGLGSETNFMVVKSDLTLELTGTDGDLWNATVNVSGVISEPTYSVWVNGVQGTNYGDGTWSANNVPVSVGGVASFDMSASSGGGDPDSNTNMDKPAEIVTVQYGDGKSAIGLEQGWNHTTHTRTKNYNNNYIIDGNGQYASQGWVETVVDYDGDTASGGGWSDYVMSSTNPGVYYEHDIPDTGADYYGMGFIGGDEDSNYQISSVPDEDLDEMGDVGYTGYGDTGAWVTHYYANNVHWAWDKDGNHEDLTVDARMRMQLLTGGKAGSGKLNLFCISAWAQEYGAPAETSQWQGTQQWNIDSTRIMVMGKYLNTNGNAYVVLPDNSAPDLDLEIPGVRHYNAAAGVQKYHSHFEVFVHQPWPNYPNDIFDPDAVPLGYPIVNGFDPGHAWWELVTEAPREAIYYFSKNHSGRWANSEVGFEAATTLNWLIVLSGECPTAPGKFPYYTSDPKDVQRTYNIGFPGLLGGLNHCENIYWNTPVYNLCNNNCVNQTFITGGAAGVLLPNDWDPEDFGFDLPPSDP